MSKQNLQLAKFQIEVETGNEGPNGEPEVKVCYLKEMNRGVLEVVLSMVQPKGNEKPKYLEAGEKILRSCMLPKALTKTGDEVTSDPEILEDDSLLIAAAMQAYELIDVKTARLKKL